MFWRDEDFKSRDNNPASLRLKLKMQKFENKTSLKTAKILTKCLLKYWLKAETWSAHICAVNLKLKKQTNKKKQLEKVVEILISEAMWLSSWNITKNSFKLRE